MMTLSKSLGDIELSKGQVLSILNVLLILLPFVEATMVLKVYPKSVEGQRIL
jgi:hypothetical protein